MKIIIILGYKLLKNGQMSVILKQRLNKGIERYKKGDIFIVSGGKVQDTIHTESYMMKKYIKNMLPQAVIITESQSKSTIENIQNIKPIINKYNLKKILITSKNHIGRVKKIVSDYKLDIEILY